MVVDTLPKLCGYGNGWCKVSPSSWWECKKILLDNRIGGNGCRYFSSNHLAYPILTMNEKRELVLDAKRHSYDKQFPNVVDYGEVEPGIIKVDDIGYCDLCKLPTYFWDTNIEVYICGRSCRKLEYVKLDG